MLACAVRWDKKFNRTSIFRIPYIKSFETAVNKSNFFGYLFLANPVYSCAETDANCEKLSCLVFVDHMPIANLLTNLHRKSELFRLYHFKIFNPNLLCMILVPIPTKHTLTAFLNFTYSIRDLVAALFDRIHFIKI